MNAEYIGKLKLNRSIANAHNEKRKNSINQHSKVRKTKERQFFFYYHWIARASNGVRNGMGMREMVHLGQL